MNIQSKFEKYIISKYDKIKISSTDINYGDIFIALKGKNYHGNKFIKSSIKKGAKFCLTDKKNYDQNEKIIFVDDVFDYLTNLAIKKRLLYKGKVIGITGSAGKTTFKETLSFFLKNNNIISYSKKSFNNELGVLISLLNLNLKSKYAIFEMGTNNFGEIKYLTKLVKPEQIFITNILSTHLENFKTKNNIGKEKSDIFISKYNNQREKLFLFVSNKEEKNIFKRAKKEKKMKVIRIDNMSKKYFIKNIISNKNNYEITFSINKKITKIKTKSIVMFRLINLLFCYAFFDENKMNINIISNKQKYLKPVDGRGLEHLIRINKKTVKIIDESYNANPDTMSQSIDYFGSLKEDSNKKVLILGNMNELGKNSQKMHTELLNKIDKINFKTTILCGEFFRTSIKKLLKPKNEFIYLDNKDKIMKYLQTKVHNDDIIMIKCSNATEVNMLAKDLLKKKVN